MDESILKWLEFGDRSVENSEDLLTSCATRVGLQGQLTLDGLFVSNPGQSASHLGTLLPMHKDPLVKLLEKPV